MTQDVPSKALTPFLTISFALTWGLAAAWMAAPDALTRIFGELEMTNPLFLAAVYAPGIAAFVLVPWYTGLTGLKRFCRRLMLWRCAASWYLMLIVGVPLLMYLGATVADNPWSVAKVPLSAIAVALLIGPMEEFGWRGVMQPLLQRRYPPSLAGLIVGIVWGVWHIPAFLLSGTPQSAWSFAPYFLALLGAAMLFTGLLNASRGSLLLAALLHFQLNNPLWPDAQPYDALFFTAAALLMLWVRKEDFGRDKAVTAVAV